MKLLSRKESLGVHHFRLVIGASSTKAAVQWGANSVDMVITS